MKFAFYRIGNEVRYGQGVCNMCVHMCFCQPNEAKFGRECRHSSTSYFVVFAVCCCQFFVFVSYPAVQADEHWLEHENSVTFLPVSLPNVKAKQLSLSERMEFEWIRLTKAEEAMRLTIRDVSQQHYMRWIGALWINLSRYGGVVKANEIQCDMNRMSEHWAMPMQGRRPVFAIKIDSSNNKTIIFVHFLSQCSENYSLQIRSLVSEWRWLSTVSVESRMVWLVWSQWYSL